jgi:hypothetical protein
MQQLSGRDTYTPQDIPQVLGNCGLSLNVVGTPSVAGLKTPDNTPDAALTPRKGKKGGFMLAFRSLLERAKTLLAERRNRLLLSTLKGGVSEA